MVEVLRILALAAGLVIGVRIGLRGLVMTGYIMLSMYVLVLVPVTFLVIMPRDFGFQSSSQPLPMLLMGIIWVLVLRLSISLGIKLADELALLIQSPNVNRALGGWIGGWIAGMLATLIG